MATAEIENTENCLHLLTLPNEVLENTLSFLDFNEICDIRLSEREALDHVDNHDDLSCQAKRLRKDSAACQESPSLGTKLSVLKQVCKDIDKVCQQVLNQGFSNAEKLHAQIYKEIKAKLPRRESERRSHPLARHMDLLAAIETRLSLLAMTYIKYMEMAMCCFIPGKVLDEIYHILHTIRNESAPPRPHELLRELRDISSMAMEHFEEKIVPVLKGKIRHTETEMSSSLCLVPCTGAGTSGFQPGFQVKIPAGPPNPVMNSRVPPLRMEIVQLRNTLRSTSSTVVSLRKEVNDCKSIISDQHKKMLEQDKKIVSHSQSLCEVRKKMAEQEKMLINLQNCVLRLEGRTKVDFEDSLAESDVLTSESTEQNSKELNTEFSSALDEPSSSNRSKTSEEKEGCDSSSKRKWCDKPKDNKSRSNRRKKMKSSLS